MHLPRPRPRPRSRAAALGVGALFFSLSCAAFAQESPLSATKPIFEEWAVIVLEGKTCGYAMTIVTPVSTPSGPGYLTSYHEEFLTKRLGSTMKTIETSKVVEDAQGGVLNFDDVYEGGSSVECSGERHGDDMVVSSRGETQRFHLPRLTALGPEAVRRATLQVPLKPGQPFTFETFDTDYPQGITEQKGTVVRRETRDIRGVKRDVWRLESSVSYMAGETSTTWVDDQGNDVESDAQLPGVGTIHEYVTNRDECLKQLEGVEVFTSSLIRPQVGMPHPRELAQAVYRLTSVDSSSKLTLWNGDGQSILSSEPGTSEVEVNLPRFTPADAVWELPHDDTPELHTYLQSSAYLEVGTPIIQSLARQAVGDEKNPVLAAHKIQQFVRKYITKKDLKIDFGSAEETAKSREGDCTEHAVLCAALGRAAGLPTRCVVGLGYIPPGAIAPTLTKAVGPQTGIFAFHMWAEAWIGDGKWVPMDAALDGFDVGHIAILKTALEEVNPMVDLNVPMLQLMSGLKIDVEKTVPLGKALPPVARATPPPTALPPPARVSTLPPLD